MNDFAAIVLAGERPGGNALARSLGLPAGVLAPLEGKTCIARVLEALGNAARVGRVVVCGPDASVVAECPDLESLLKADGVRWQAPERGPAASALAAATAIERYPMLLTSGDHGLLDAATIDAFCHTAERVCGADFVVGLVPHERVAQAFPHSRRTVLRFADGGFCGSNLFALLTPASACALEFWRAVEADRKHPWRLVRHLGIIPLLRYLTGRLTIAEAFSVVSRRARCRVAWIPVEDPRAAVDVDSEADRLLAERVLRDATAHGTALP